MDGTRIRLLGAVVGAFLVVPLLSGCGAVDGLFPQSPATSDVFAIVVGDCLDDADAADEVTSVPVVDCSEPHDSEVFARSLVSGTAFPGDEELEAQLTEFCRGEVFTEFVGVPFADSQYFTGGYFPTPASWASGDRELLCTIRADGVKTTDSLRGVEKPTPAP